MALTREEIQEFIAALHDDPELRELTRAAILSDDFQALPGLLRANTESIAALDQRLARLTERIETFIAATDLRFSDVEHRQEAVEQRLASIEARLIRVEKQTNDAAGKLGNLEGDAFEERFIRNIRAHIGPRFRRPRPLDVYSDDALEKALSQMPITPEELRDVANADVLVWSMDTESGREAALVMEISRAIDLNDVVRAARRARLLAKTGVNALAVVAGMSISDEAARGASDSSVVAIVQKQAEEEPAA